MAFKMKAGKEGPMKKNFGIGKNLPDGRSTSSAFQADQRFVGPLPGSTIKEDALSEKEKKQLKNINAYREKNQNISGQEKTKKKPSAAQTEKKPSATQAKNKKPDWSKAPKLNTQARRDWYTKNNLAQDATTKLKPSTNTTTKPDAKTSSNVKSNLKPPTKLPKLSLTKPKLTPTTSNLLGTISASIKPKAKDETNIKLKKNKLTGGTKAKVVQKFDDKVIKTKTKTDKKGNTKTKTKTRKRTAGKGKQKIAKALTKFASKLLK